MIQSARASSRRGREVWGAVTPCGLVVTLRRIRLVRPIPGELFSQPLPFHRNAATRWSKVFPIWSPGSRRAKALELDAKPGVLLNSLPIDDRHWLPKNIE